MVVPPGFEPRLAEPKSDVLPLHHGTILVCFVKSSAKVAHYIERTKLFRPFFQNGLWGVYSLGMGCSAGLPGPLFRDEQEVAFLAALRQDILVANEVGVVDLLVILLQLLLVDHHTAGLHGLAHLSLGGEDGGLIGQQVDGLDAFGQLLAGDGELGHALEHLQEGGLIDGAQHLGGGAPEEDLGGVDCHLIVFARVYHHGDLFGQPLLQRTQVGGGLLLADQCLDLFAGEGGEDLDVLLRVGIAYVEPELVELVGRGVAPVEPYVAALGLAELAAIGLGDERTDQCEGFASLHATDELRAGGDVAPLVGAAHLQAHALLAVEVQEVIALQQLVGELGEGHPFTGLAAQSLLHRVFRHHVVDGEVLADVADEVEKGVVFHPVVVVHQDGPVGDVALEIEEPGQLLLDGLLVVAQRSLVEQVALGGLHGGVTDHAGGTAYQGDGRVPGALQVLQHHHPHQVTDMQ